LIPAGGALVGDEVGDAVEVDVGDDGHVIGGVGGPGGLQAALVIEHHVADDDLREFVVVEVVQHRAV